MAKAKLQFSLLTIFFLTAAVAVTVALAFNLPSGQFVFESLEARRRSILPGEIVMRLIVVSPLVAAECAGIVLIANPFKRLQKR